MYYNIFMAVLSSFSNGNKLFLMSFRHCHTTYPNVVLKKYADIVWQCLTLKCFVIQGIFIFCKKSMKDTSVLQSLKSRKS